MAFCVHAKSVDTCTYKGQNYCYKMNTHVHTTNSSCTAFISLAFFDIFHPINGRPLLVCLSATSTINTENALDTLLIYTMIAPIR